MNKSEIQFTKSALKELESLPSEALHRALEKIEILEDNPFPRGCKKIVGNESLWRLRMGDYRIVYSVEGSIVLVIAIGHRKDIYR